MSNVLPDNDTAVSTHIEVFVIEMKLLSIDFANFPQFFLHEFKRDLDTLVWRAVKMQQQEKWALH